MAADKQTVRETVWSRLEDAGVALFPGARGRIPNFKGAAAAADQLASTEVWRAAGVVKCNPDAPQRPVRLRALRDGKTVYMAVPRLRDLRCFWELDPRRVASLADAVTIAGAARVGRPVDPRRLPHVDLVVAGSVAVSRGGERVGKGGGYSDLEYAIGREVGAIDDRTSIATTVHPLQILAGRLPTTAHDFSLDLVVTFEEVILTGRSRPQPPGILDDDLTDAVRASIPILKALGHR